jgi:adenosylmethionine-8-amino-7-oxononanoate aminotransferase
VSLEFYDIESICLHSVVGATSGCTPAVPGYFKAMREVCDRYGALFILDEIMCGIGRSGKMHAWRWEDLASPPDIQVNGKGLGGGYAPLAAVLISAKVVDIFAAGSGSFNNIFSYQSHAVGCRATLEILKIIKEDRLIEQCYQRGIFLEKILKEQLGDHLHVGDIRLVYRL